MTMLNGEGFYKTGFWAAIAFIVALIYGQYSPNRNIVTVDQLQKSDDIINARMDSIQSQLTANTDAVNMLTGELKAQKLLQP